MTARDHIHVEYWGSKDGPVLQSHIARDEREASGFVRMGQQGGFLAVMRPCGRPSCPVPEDD